MKKFLGKMSSKFISCIVTSWSVGTASLVVTVPHGGTVGQDSSPAGSLICPDTEHTIETRRGTVAHPILVCRQKSLAIKTLLER